ncbi:hypothetical protein JFV29_13320 [Peribacillus sp. TH16]|uniref:hypothetical protein n=1 Tax=Peribacillus sp. TH16 TaxID=2798482 RepID=UPI0019128ADD|nr:hypothetical protein [Peribacillus sp. TH16]MBK5482854.1 hypothetical protein [Peribacillus sp. TH16]
MTENEGNTLQGVNALNKQNKPLQSVGDPSNGLSTLDNSSSEENQMKSVGQQNVRSINGQELQGKNVAVTPTNQRQTIQQVIVNSFNNHPNGNKKNEQILAKMKLKEALDPPKNLDATSNVRLNPGNKSINQNKWGKH